MGANFGDLDNDGYPDFYLGTGYPTFDAIGPNVMYRNDGGESFSDVTFSGGFGHIQKGHGVAFGDLDRDGDQDIFVQMGGFYPGDGFPNALFENPGHGGRWLSVRLEGTESNRAGIGARIRIDVEEDGRMRTVYAHVGSGGSFGASSIEQEIGLGRASRIVYPWRFTGRPAGSGSHSTAFRSTPTSWCERATTGSGFGRTYGASASAEAACVMRPVADARRAGVESSSSCDTEPSGEGHRPPDCRRGGSPHRNRRRHRLRPTRADDRDGHGLQDVLRRRTGQTCGEGRGSPDGCGRGDTAQGARRRCRHNRPSPERPIQRIFR